MVKIKIIEIGLDKNAWVTEATEHYVKLLGRWAKVEIDRLLPAKSASSLPPDELKRAQAKSLQARLDKGAVVALSDRGKEFTSESFANFIEQLQSRSGGTINFIIGGAFGLDDSVIEQSEHMVSLSRMTFSHQLVRPILLEQLYRAFSILAGTAYHK